MNENELELNTRFSAVVLQRNDALNVVALLNGQMAVLKAMNENLKKDLERYKGPKEPDTPVPNGDVEDVDEVG